MLRVELGGAALGLHPSGALWIEAERTWVVADAHFGKAQSFRSLGVPVPGGTTAANLQKLDVLLQGIGATRLVFLGDLLHSSRSLDGPLNTEFVQWREQHARLDVTLVRGNHDAHAGDPPDTWNIRPVDEPWRLGPWILWHHVGESTLAGGHHIQGHLHPCVVLRTGSNERLRLPVFWQQQIGLASLLTLPAFGEFTGMKSNKPTQSDRVFAIAADQVRAVPVLGR